MEALPQVPRNLFRARRHGPGVPGRGPVCACPRNRPRSGRAFSRVRRVPSKGGRTYAKWRRVSGRFCVRAASAECKPVQRWQFLGPCRTPHGNLATIDTAQLMRRVFGPLSGARNKDVSHVDYEKSDVSPPLERERQKSRPTHLKAKGVLKGELSGRRRS